jgi:Xaa-Pro aminopeptidase
MTLGAGTNVFELHHMPSNYRLQIGDLLHVDFGCFFKGYLSDISRMAAVGKPDSTQQKAYDIALQVEYAAAAAMSNGTKVLDVHNAVKQCYNASGFSYNRAFIGHGLGIGCHESPFLGPSHADWTLKTGMFFQIEPSIAVKHVRVHTEDSFIVLNDGAKNVSEYRDISELQLIK